MKVIKVSGETLDDLMKQVIEHFTNMEDENSNREPINNSSEKRESDKTAHNYHTCRCGEVTPDISKIFWIDKKINDDQVYTTFNVIAPFAIENSIKASISKINEEYWLTLRYTNNEEVFADCQTVNFKTRKQVEYKYNFRDYKVDKKKLKLSYNSRGIISLYTVSSKIPPKTEDYTIGL